MLVSLEEAIELLKKDKVVAVPTETVYGLAALISSPAAIDKIFSLKKRPSDNPLIVHVASIEQLRDLVTSLPIEAEALIEAFWPGALTMILPAAVEKILFSVRAGLETVGVRMPNHAKTLELIRAVGPLVAPSANLSGRPSSTSAEHVAEDFGEVLPVFSGGICDQGVESTIVALEDGKWKILRLGAISAEELQRVLGYSVWTDQEGLHLFDAEKPLCPGQKYRHYAPSARLVMGGDSYPGFPQVVVGFDGRDYPGAEKIFRLGDIKSPRGVEKNLYAILRSLDSQGIKEAWVDANFDPQGPLRTVFERLKKASTHACQSGQNGV